MSEVLLLALLALASYRVTRLVTTDKITEPLIESLRQRLETRWIYKNTARGSTAESDAIESPDWNSKAAYLLSCTWCLGFWVSGVGTLIVSLVYGLEYPILTWLAVATIVGMIGTIDTE